MNKIIAACVGFAIGAFIFGNNANASTGDNVTLLTAGAADEFSKEILIKTRNTHLLPVKKVLGSDATVLMITGISYNEHTQNCLISITSMVGFRQKSLVTINENAIPHSISGSTFNSSAAECGAKFAEAIEENGKQLVNQTKSLIKGGV